MVQITPAAARPNPFAGHFPFPAPELNHFKRAKASLPHFHDQWSTDTKIWPSKAQTSVKNYYLKNSVRQIQSKSWKHLSESLQSTASIYMLLHFGYHLTIHPKVLRNPLPTWSLPDAYTSILAGCFHFTLPHSCCPFFFKKVCLVANGPRYILSAFWQCNLKAISWQISSNGACMVIAKLVYHPEIAVSLVHCFSFTSLPSVSGYSVNIQQDRNIHTHTISHYNK